MIRRLETERLILRTPEAGDAQAWTEFFMSDRSRFIRGEGLDEKIGWRALASIIGHWTLNGCGTFVFALRETPDAPLGMAGPWLPRGWPERELGWHLWSADHEGRGYAFEAASAARDHAFRDLGWETAVSYIDPRNLRSLRLAERLGAAPDWSAAQPDDDDPVVVFRHPNPEASS